MAGFTGAYDPRRSPLLRHRLAACKTSKRQCGVRAGQLSTQLARSRACLNTLPDDQRCRAHECPSHMALHKCSSQRKTKVLVGKNEHQAFVARPARRRRRGPRALGKYQERGRGRDRRREKNRSRRQARTQAPRRERRPEAEASAAAARTAAQAEEEKADADNDETVDTTPSVAEIRAGTSEGDGAARRAAESPAPTSSARRKSSGVGALENLANERRRQPHRDRSAARGAPLGRLGQRPGVGRAGVGGTLADDNAANSTLHRRAMIAQAGGAEALVALVKHGAAGGQEVGREGRWNGSPATPPTRPRSPMPAASRRLWRS